MVDENGDCVVENFTVGRRGSVIPPPLSFLIGRVSTLCCDRFSQATAPSFSLVTSM